jgi:tetratricopeptide (TPR) repeat protein
VAVVRDSEAARLSHLDTFPDLLHELERWRVRAARGTGKARLSLRDLAAATGLPHSSLANYLSGATVMPVDVLDAVVLALGARPEEAREWAQAWERASIGRARPAAADAESGSIRPGPVVPRQLPGAVGRFVGRTAELRVLTERLDSLTRPGGTVVVSAIDGTAGIGKTALAVHFARQVAERFPDGQLYVNLRGFDPSGRPMRPAEAVRGFLDAFQVPPAQVPADAQAQVSLYRSLVADKRVLVVLDNARDAAQVRPLLPGGASCLTLVTSRNQLTPLVATDGAHPLTLDLLSTEEARELLERHAGPRRLAGAAEAVDALITLCARLPLALSITAARATSRPAFPLTALVDELRDSRTRLSALDAGDPLADVRAVFSWSYRNLSPAAARLFRLLGLHPGPDIGLAAVVSLAGLSEAETRPALAELTHAHLLTEHVPGRYTFHDLLRAYAADQAEEADGEAVPRVLSHYLHTTHAAALLLRPGGRPLHLPTPPLGCVPEDLADHRSAAAWLDTEHQVLLAAVSQAAESGHSRHAWMLAWSLAGFQERRGYWDEAKTSQLTALEAARRSGDLEGEAQTHRRLGCASLDIRHYAEAVEHLEQALTLFRELGDHAGQATTQVNLAEAAHRQGDPQAALDHITAALAAARSAGDQDRYAMALNGAGMLANAQGDARAGLRYAQQALEVAERAGIPSAVASAWDTRGDSCRHLGQHADALVCYQRAARLYDKAGDRLRSTEVFVNMGETHLALGDLSAARAVWQRALDILDELGHPEAEDVRARLRRLSDGQPLRPS